MSKGRFLPGLAGGKLVGEVKDRAIAMGWDVEKANVYFSLGYVGLLISTSAALFTSSVPASMINSRPPGRRTRHISSRPRW